MTLVPERELHSIRLSVIKARDLEPRDLEPRDLEPRDLEPCDEEPHGIEPKDEPAPQVFADPSGRRARCMWLVELLLLLVTIGVIVALVAGVTDIGRRQRVFSIDHAAGAS